MFNVVFDVSFVEESVSKYVLELEKRGECANLKDFYRERDRLYEISSPFDRETSFRRFYEEKFSAFGLRNLFCEIFSEFPLLDNPKITILVKPVFDRNSEGAELFGIGQYSTVLITMQSFRVVDENYLKAFLRHELMHVSDMLDPQFSYHRGADLAALNETDENLIRERFRILWALYVDARICKKGFIPLRPIEYHRQEFEKAFPFLPGEEKDRIFDRLTASEKLTHADLIRWSKDPRVARTIGDGGLLCPICHLPAHEDFSKNTSGQDQVIQSIKHDRPDWDVSMGICSQCFDLYASRVKVVL